MCVFPERLCVCVFPERVSPRSPRVCVCVRTVCVCARSPRVCVYALCVCARMPPRSHMCVCVRGVPNGGAIEQTCPGNEENGGSVLQLYKHFIDLVFTWYLW